MSFSIIKKYLFKNQIPKDFNKKEISKLILNGEEKRK